ncbi:MAG TPA: hypothetical protein VGS21_05550, partial [Acidimicrobiales bacterium]|nr:hypothetical protein [Acidimicrobiales bacterium]
MSPRHNLPAGASSFVGRRDDIATVLRLIPEVRIVTLAGPPGAGKTRLSIEVARQLVDSFPDGAFIVELSAVADGRAIVPTIASAIGTRLASAATQALATSLALDRMLIVLDNCEHLLADCADVTNALVAGCPGVTILATSREPLRATGEAVYRLPPLEVPNEGETDLRRIAGVDSTLLFVSRARTQDPDFVLDEVNAGLVGNLCRRLDGMPLAIEMAAARLRVLSLAQIHERLDGRLRLLVDNTRGQLPHHRTLDALTAWSYDLLAADDRRLLRQLSVFVPGFDLDAVTGFLGHIGEAVDTLAVLDRLSGLVDKSLLVSETGGDIARYRMLETIRQYGLDRLTVEEGELGVEGARGAHAAVYRARAEQWQAGYLTPRHKAALGRTTGDYENLRVALDFLTASPGQSRAAAEMIVALRQFFVWSGRRMELVAAIEALGERPELVAADGLTARYQLLRFTMAGRGDPQAVIDGLRALRPVAAELGDVGLESQVLNRLTSILFMVGEVDGVPELREEARELARASGDYESLVIALGSPPTTRELLLEEVDLASERGDVLSCYQALGNLGTMYWDEDIEQSRRYYEEALTLLVAANLGEIDGHLYNNLGHALVVAGARDRGRELVARGYELSRRHGDIREMNFGLYSLAYCAFTAGETILAATLLGGCERQEEMTGFAWEEEIVAEIAQLTDRLRKQLGDRQYELAFELGRR